jgi:hypothetical protein
MIRLAEKVIDYLPEVPLYARVDMLFDEKRKTFLLIELEILDARLYLSNQFFQVKHNSNLNVNVLRVSHWNWMW